MKSYTISFINYTNITVEAEDENEAYDIAEKKNNYGTYDECEIWEVEDVME